MTLTAEIMYRVLPADRPPWEPSTPEEADKASWLSLRDGGDGPFTRGYFWQKYLTRVLRENRGFVSDSLVRLGFPEPGLEMAVGYIEVDIAFAGEEIVRQASKATGYFFGAVLYDHRAGSDGDIRSVVDLGQLAEPLKGVPAVRMPAADIPHAPNLANATAACWTAKTGSGKVDGILTAKHAIAGIARGRNVAMAGGGFGKLVDFCDGSVDAAVIDPPSRPNNPVSLPMDVDPMIGLGIEFNGVTSGLKSGTISKTWVFPTDDDPYDPQRVHFDITGKPGDSGALVRLVSTGAAIGIYTGVKTGASTRSGMSQAIWQATSLLNIDLFE